MAVILDGKAVAEKIAEELKTEIAKLSHRPKLVVLRANNDAASAKFIELKLKRAEELGIDTELIEFDAETPEEAILVEIQKQNDDHDTTGILVQLPVYKHIDAQVLLNEISPLKDVDGLSAYSLGLLTQDFAVFYPAVVQAVDELLFAYGIEIEGKNIVIVGASAWVGKPLAIYLTNQGATVTICHDKTENLSEKTAQADILISATGVPGLIKSDFVKEGAVVIDIGAGQNRETQKIEGDVDFKNVSQKAGFITPVPGGVGPLTVISLLSQVVLAATELSHDHTHED